MASVVAQVSPQILKELKTRRATVTPFYWGVKTILKVQARPLQAVGLSDMHHGYEEVALNVSIDP